MSLDDKHTLNPPPPFLTRWMARSWAPVQKKLSPSEIKSVVKLRPRPDFAATKSCQLLAPTVWKKLMLKENDALQKWAAGTLPGAAAIHHRLLHLGVEAMALKLPGQPLPGHLGMEAKVL